MTVPKRIGYTESRSHSCTCSLQDDQLPLPVLEGGRGASFPGNTGMSK